GLAGIGTAIGGVGAGLELDRALDLRGAAKAGAAGGKALGDPGDAAVALVFATINVVLAVVDAAVSIRSLSNLLRANKLIGVASGAGRDLLSTMSSGQIATCAKALDLEIEGSSAAALWNELERELPAPTYHAAREYFGRVAAGVAPGRAADLARELGRE